MKMQILLFLLFPALVFSQNNYSYNNLVMEGGGVRGLAYSGALEVLEQKGILQHIENVAGSSAGAIAGLMVSLNYNSHEIDSVLQILKIQDFNDGKFFIGEIRRVRKEYGIYKGDKFENWLGQLIKYKTGNADITFNGLRQLHLGDKRFKNFYCTATNITKQQLEILSWKNWPGMELKTAVHMSGCIPFYFVPVAIDSVGKEVLIKDTSVKYDLYVDGGMLCNYPINIFDSCVGSGNSLTSENVIYNTHTLGLKLERGVQIAEYNKNYTDIAPFQIENMKQYSSAVMNLMMESINRKSPGLINEKGRTIYISYGDISGRPRRISLEEKKTLHDNGVAAANKFFNEPSVAN
jgi:NTE family protein